MLLHKLSDNKSTQPSIYDARGFFYFVEQRVEQRGRYPFIFLSILLHLVFERAKIQPGAGAIQTEAE